MNATDFAYASGAWFAAFGVFQFPVGMLLDSIGPRRTAGYIFTIFAGGGAFVFALAPNTEMIIVAMALIGIGCSVALMAPMYIFVREYDAARFATLISLFVGIGTLGNIASSEPLAAAVELYGWRQCAFALGWGTLAVGFAILFFVRDPEKLERQDGQGGYAELFRIRELWLIFPVILCGYMVGAGLRSSWIGPFHSELYGYETLQIGRVTLYMSIALVLGTFFYGPLDRIFNSRKKVVLFGQLATLICCLAMAFSLPEDPLWSAAAFAFIGFAGANYAVQMAHGKSFLPVHLTGRGVTLLNFCSIGGAGIFQWLSGVFVEMQAVPGDPRIGYEALFYFYSFFICVACLIYAFSKDAEPNSRGF